MHKRGSNGATASRINKPVFNASSRLVKNDITSDACGVSPFTMRQMWLQNMMDPRRDLDKECGYPPSVLPIQYRFMYDREGIGTRVVDIYPDECWAVDPEVYEQEGTDKTPFEKGWDSLLLESENNPLSYLHRIDCQSGIGRYGVLFLGTDDGLPIDQPLPGIGPDGKSVGRPKEYDLAYMRCFDESFAHILAFETNEKNPRFGRPLYYNLLFSNILPGQSPGPVASVTLVNKTVHWSRVIHVADRREGSEVFGVPRMQPVFNRLCDVRKILGGSAEMFWKGGFPGYSFELSPELTMAGVDFDKDKLEEQLQRYSDGLQRYLAVIGLNAKSLAPQVANPDPTLTAQLNAIAISIGCPLRIFTGSEQAQLASGQDVRTWNRRLTRRQKRYLTPFLVRPFIDRMVAIGRLPPHKGQYEVHWPDVNMPSAEDQSKIADRQTAAILKYVTGGGYQLIPPMEFLTMLLGMSIEQAKAIEAKMNKWIAGITPPAIQAVETQAKADAKMQKEAIANQPATAPASTAA